MQNLPKEHEKLQWISRPKLFFLFVKMYKGLDA